MQANVRHPAVAGYFYPSEKQSLLEDIRRCFADTRIGPGHPFEPTDIRIGNENQKAAHGTECFVVPHAGYNYSGPVAAHSYFRIKSLVSGFKGELIAIILGPNHYGIGSGIALSPSIEWETPLGSLKVNHEAGEELADNSDIIDTDELAHSREHSIEVQLPFLQMVADTNSLTIVPISMMLQDKESAEDVAESIFKVIQKKSGSKESSFLIIGSSDLTHYEPHAKAFEQDMKLIRKIEQVDVDSYYTTLDRNNISACGYGAIATTMLLAKKIGKIHGNLLKYASSGDVTGEKKSVVGYSAVQFI